MNDKNLAELLYKWFSEHKDKHNKWCNTLVGQVIKSELMKIGNWKNKMRGNPRKGYQAKISNQLLK